MNAVRSLVPLTAAILISSIISSCATQDARPIDSGSALATNAAALPVVNRVTWGANASTMQHVARTGLPRYVDEQLGPPHADALPPAIAQQIGAMTISTKPLVALVQDLEQ